MMGSVILGSFVFISGLFLGVPVLEGLLLTIVIVAIGNLDILD